MKSGRRAPCIHSVGGLCLDAFWANTGALVLLEVIGPAERTGSAPYPIATVRVERVLAHGASPWCEALPELRVALAVPLERGRRALAVLVPVNMTPGVLLTDAVDAETNEHELVTQLRHAIAQRQAEM